MEEKYISILFDLKVPEDSRDSTINTIVLLLREIRDMKDLKQMGELDVFLFNENIERMKKELDNIKIIKYEAD